MCLIVHKPAAVTVPVELLEDAHSNNRDGWGIMWAEFGKVKTVKGFKLERLIEAVDILQGHELLIHLRMATHGDVNLANCHPFKVTDNLYMMHNGVIKIDRIKKSESDTAAFTTAIASMLQVNPDLIFDPGWQMLVKKFIGDSRLAFMNAEGAIAIINREDGIEWRGLWCSNTYAWSLWAERPKVSATTAKQYTFPSGWSCYEDDEYLKDPDEGYYAPDLDTLSYEQVSNLQYLRKLDLGLIQEICFGYPDLVAEAIWNG